MGRVRKEGGHACMHTRVGQACQLVSWRAMPPCGIPAQPTQPSLKVKAVVGAVGHAAPHRTHQRTVPRLTQQLPPRSAATPHHTTSHSPLHPGCCPQAPPSARAAPGTAHAPAAAQRWLHTHCRPPPARGTAGVPPPAAQRSRDVWVSWHWSMGITWQQRQRAEQAAQGQAERSNSTLQGQAGRASRRRRHQQHAGNTQAAAAAAAAHPCLPPGVPLRQVRRGRWAVCHVEHRDVAAARVRQHRGPRQSGAHRGDAAHPRAHHQQGVPRLKGGHKVDLRVEQGGEAARQGRAGAQRTKARQGITGRGVGVCFVLLCFCVL
jgi:hypothetical protein